MVSLTPTLTVHMLYLVTAPVDGLGLVNTKGLGAIGRNEVLLLTFSRSEDFFLFADILRLGILLRLIKHILVVFDCFQVFGLASTNLWI